MVSCPHEKTYKDGKTKLQVKFEGETAWLTQEQMAELFDKGRSTITEHINNIFEESELEENSVCREFRRTGASFLLYYINAIKIIKKI